jgi:hypothetical protein
MNTIFAGQPTLQKKGLEAKIKKVEKPRQNTQDDKGHLK